MDSFRDRDVRGLPPALTQHEGMELLARIRTVTVTLSRLLGEIIEQVLSSRVELEVVARLDDWTALCARLQPLLPDLILVGLSSDDTDALAGSILECVPGAKVIAFTGDGRHAFLHEMRAHRAALIDVTPEALIAAIIGNRIAGRI